MTPRFRSSPGRITAACVGVVCGIWAVSLWGCGDLIGVGSLRGDDVDGASVRWPAADDAGVRGADAVSEDVGVDSIDASAEAADAAGDESDDGPETTGCPLDSGVQWLRWQDPAVPMGAFPAGLEPVTGSDPDAGSYHYFVCRARDADDRGDIIPGEFVDSIGCLYSLDGIRQFQSADYDVLLDPNGCLNWTTYDGGLAQAVVGGRLGQVPLYMCSAPLSPQAPWWQAGYLEGVPDASCRVPTRGGKPLDIAMGITIVTQ